MGKYESGFHGPSGTWGVRTKATGRYVLKGMATNVKAEKAARIYNEVEPVDYPAEVAEVDRLNLHPDEAKPRALTFIHERQNWQREVEALRAHIDSLNAHLAEDWPKEGRACPNCKQVWDAGSTGKYPCQVCGMPRVHDK